MKLHTLFKAREPENHTLLGGIKYPVADTDVFPVVASPHWKILSGGEKRRPEIRLCPQATAPRRETHTTAEPLYNEFLGITNDYPTITGVKFTPVIVKYMPGKEPRYIKTSLYSEHIFILPVTLPFVISKILCRRIIAQSVPSVLITPRAFVALFSSCRSRRWGIFQKTSAWRWRICQFF